MFYLIIVGITFHEWGCFIFFPKVWCNDSNISLLYFLLNTKSKYKLTFCIYIARGLEKFMLTLSINVILKHRTMTLSIKQNDRFEISNVNINILHEYLTLGAPLNPSRKLLLLFPWILLLIKWYVAGGEKERIVIDGLLSTETWDCNSDTYWLFSSFQRSLLLFASMHTKRGNNLPVIMPFVLFAYTKVNGN